MPFDPLCQLDLTEDWQITPPTQGNYFRFGYANNLGFSYLVVAQAQVGDGGSLELFGAFRFNLKGQGADIVELDIPRVFNPEHRRLAVRGLGSRNQPGKTLHISIEAISMIVNPTGSTNSSVSIDFLQTDSASREAAPANPNRNGGLVFNRGSKALWLSFGNSASRSSPIKVLVGGVMDIPAGYVGPIFGLFDAADPALTARAQIIEFVS